jgi:hypothetical protein
MCKMRNRNYDMMSMMRSIAVGSACFQAKEPGNFKLRFSTSFHPRGHLYKYPLLYIIYYYVRRARCGRDA